jgi:hypothetical protein
LDKEIYKFVSLKKMEVLNMDFIVLCKYIKTPILCGTKYKQTNIIYGFIMPGIHIKIRGSITV